MTREEVGANTETDKQFLYNTYVELLKNVDAKPGMTKTETYEEWAKNLFTDEPANMKVLVVVDKLLTGFDAPPCTYLYIDKSMQDHGLFQAICRVNRLDGEDKEFGYIVDYKDLFKKVENAIAVYSSELDHSAVAWNLKCFCKIASQKAGSDSTALSNKSHFSANLSSHPGASLSTFITSAATPSFRKTCRSESHNVLRSTKRPLHLCAPTPTLPMN